MKKLIGIIIICLILIASSFLIFQNSVEGYTYTDDNGITWYYQVSGGSAINVYVYSYTTMPETLEIPEELNGYPVLSLARNYSTRNICNSTSYNRNVKKIIIPDTVVSIGSYTFARFAALTTVVISSDSTANFELPTNLNTIGSYAFQNCSSLTEVNVPINTSTYAFQNCTKLTKVTFSDKVTEINDYAFANCSSLTDVTFTNNIRTIGNYAFLSCSSLNNIVLPEGLTRLGNAAFRYCRSLTEITIPSTIITMGTQIFQGCTALESVTLKEGIIILGDYMFSGCDAITSLTLPSTLERIGAFALEYCRGISELIIPGNVNNIGNNALQGCSGLTKMIIPDTVTVLGTYIFQNCTMLTEVSLPSIITNIPEGMFSGCTALTNIVWPTNLRTIGNSAFQGCHSLLEIVIPENLTTIGNSVFSNCIGITKVTFPASFPKINAGMFKGCIALTTIIWPQDVTTIDNNAFQNCTALTQITIPETVTTIGSTAFYNCAKITKVIVPSGITNLLDNVFGECKSLEEIILPTELRSIGSYCFSGCKKLSRVALPTSLETTKFELPGRLQAINVGVFQECIALSGDLNLPDSVISIQQSAFSGCSGFNGKLNFGSRIEEIPAYTFEKCTGFEDIVLPSTIIAVRNNAFVSSNIKDIWVNNEEENITFEMYWAGGNSPDTRVQPFIHYIGSTNSVKFNLPEGVHFIDTITETEVLETRYECGLTLSFRVVVDDGYEYRNLVMTTKSQGDYVNSEPVETTQVITNGTIVSIDRILRDKEISVQNINIDLDLVLRTSILEINKIAMPIARTPIAVIVNGKIQYKHTKYPEMVQTGDLIKYNVRIYNEGGTAGTATEVVEYLPEGLEFVEGNLINQTYSWSNVGNGKIKTTYFADKTIQPFAGVGLPNYVDAQLVCKVTATEPDGENLRLVNIAEITSATSFEADDTLGSIIGPVSSNYKREESNLSNETIYVKGTEEDDDFENVVIQRKAPISYSLRLTEIDGETSDLLSGAKFDLLDKNKEIIQSGITKEDGVIDFGLIISNGPGTDVYYIVESRTPIGYRSTSKGEIKVEVIKTIIDKDTEEYEIEVVCDLLNAELDTSMYNFIPISTKEQLAKIGSDEVFEINGKTYQFSDGKNYKLENDIDLAGENWEPIDVEGCIFDGDGHKITNLTMSYNESIARSETGLFRTYSGIIKNVILENVNINVPGIIAIGEEGSDSVTGQIGVGALVGYMNSGTISNCSVTGNIIVNDSNVGGLVGYAKEERLLIIANCTNDAKITVTGDNVGGLVGCSYSALNIRQSINNGEIQATGRNVAGLVGFSEATDYQIQNVNASYEAQSNVINLLVKNVRTYGMYTIKLETVDMNSLNLIPGSTFVILDENKEILYEDVELKDGQLEVAQINIEEVGTDVYYIKQMLAPDGYKKIDDFIKLVVTRYWDGENLDTFKVSIDVDFVSLENLEEEEPIVPPEPPAPAQKFTSEVYTNIEWKASKIKIDDSENNGKIKSEDVATAGLVGYANCSVELQNSINNGEISSKGNAAGLVGEVKQQNTETELIVNNCINNGAVSLLEQSETDSYAVAGIVALSQVRSEIEKTCNNGKISIPTTENNSLNWYQIYNAGAGIIACAEEKIYINECSNEGEIDVKLQNASAAGILGKTQNADGDANMAIYSSTNKAKIYGMHHVGGIVSNPSCNTILIDNCSVEESVIESLDGDLGGMLGCANSENVTVKNCSMKSSTLNHIGPESTYATYGKTGGMIGNVCKYGYRMGIVVNEVNVSECTVDESEIVSKNNDTAGILGFVYGEQETTKITVNNCSVDEAEIHNNDTTSCYTTAGGIMANSYNGGIIYIYECNTTNSNISVNVRTSASSYDSNVGGILGYAASLKNITMEDCNVDNVKVHNNSYMNDTCANTGGILGGIGYSGYDFSKIKRCTVKNSEIIGNSGNTGGIQGVGMYITGEVSLKDCLVENTSITSYAASNSNTNTGGVAGYLFSDVIMDNCNIKDSEITTHLGRNVGTVLGMSHGNAYMTNCSAKNTPITNIGEPSNNTCSDTIGGIVGFTMYNIYMENCHVDNCDMAGPAGNMAGLVGTICGDYNKAAFIKDSSVKNTDIATTMTTNISSSNAAVAGVIGRVGSNDITISGIDLENINLSGNSTVLGGAVASANSVEIRDVIIDNMTLTDNQGESSVTTRARGGIVGSITNKLKISDCTVKNSEISGSAASIGGIIGYCTTIEELRNCKLENSTISGGSKINVGSNGSIAGIGADLSMIKTDILNCEVNNSTIQSYSDHISGLFGTISGTEGNRILDCSLKSSDLIQTNTIIINEYNNRVIAGVLGISVNGDLEVVNPTVINSNFTAANGVNNNMIIGGIEGYVKSSKLSNAVVNGLTVQNNTLNGRVGGIVGMSENGCSIINSNVTGSNLNNIAGYIGGIAGQSHGLIQNSNVKNTEITSTSEAAYGLGGIIGRGNDVKAKGTTKVTGCTVENCILTGATAVGGIAGACVPEIIDCIVTGLNTVTEVIAPVVPVIPMPGVGKTAENTAIVKPTEVVENKIEETVIEPVQEITEPIVEEAKLPEVQEELTVQETETEKSEETKQEIIEEIKVEEPVKVEKTFEMVEEKSITENMVGEGEDVTTEKIIPENKVTEELPVEEIKPEEVIETEKLPVEEEKVEAEEIKTEIPEEKVVEPVSKETVEETSIAEQNVNTFIQAEVKETVRTIVEDAQTTYGTQITGKSCVGAILGDAGICESTELQKAVTIVNCSVNNTIVKGFTLIDKFIGKTNEFASITATFDELTSILETITE